MKNNRERLYREEISLLSAISDIISCMVVLLDRDGRIIRYNSACEQVSGVAFTEAQGRYFWDIFCQPEERELYKAFFAEIDLAKMPFSVETQLAGADGTRRDIVWEYNVLGQKDQADAPYVLTGSDVTVQKNNMQALQEIKEMYRALIHASPVAVISLARDLQVKSWSSAAESLLGWSEKDVLGQDIALFMDQNEKKIDQFARKVVNGKSFYRVEHTCSRKDGVKISIEFSMAPLRNSGGEVTGLVLIATDITERKHYEEQLKYLSMHDHLTGLYNRAFFDSELNRLDANMVYPITIIAADLDGLKLINDTLGHEHGDKLLLDCAEMIKRTLRSSDILARVGGDEFVVILPRTGREVGDIITERIKAALYNYNLTNSSLPLSISLGVATAEDCSLNMVELYREADDLMYIDKLNTGAGAKSQIIKSLMAALAERDFVTAGHAHRLEELSRQVGVRINLPDKKSGRLMLLAQVHDLGKVGIPDQILYKKGPLSDEEWKVMRKHPEKGHRIASASADLYGISELILKHHERWDGTGYPLGLKGRDIPVECRILAIVDAFDAMTNERPYKQPKSIDEALEELSNCAGSQFDPELVEVFLEVFAESTIPEE